MYLNYHWKKYIFDPLLRENGKNSTRVGKNSFEIRIAGCHWFFFAVEYTYNCSCEFKFRILLDRMLFQIMLPLIRVLVSIQSYGARVDVVCLKYYTAAVISSAGPEFAY